MIARRSRCVQFILHRVGIFHFPAVESRMQRLRDHGFQRCQFEHVPNAVDLRCVATHLKSIMATGVSMAHDHDRLMGVHISKHSLVRLEMTVGQKWKKTALIRSQKSATTTVQNCSHMQKTRKAAQRHTKYTSGDRKGEQSINEHDTCPLWEKR